MDGGRAAGLAWGEQPKACAWRKKHYNPFSMPLSSKLGHFNLLEEIAHGGMGTVYRGFDPTLNREVAIEEGATMVRSGTAIFVERRRHDEPTE